MNLDFQEVSLFFISVPCFCKDTMLGPHALREEEYVFRSNAEYKSGIKKEA